MRSRDWSNDSAEPLTTTGVGGPRRGPVPAHLQALLAVEAQIGNRATATWLAEPGARRPGPAVAQKRLTTGPGAVQRDDDLSTSPSPQVLASTG